MTIVFGMKGRDFGDVSQNKILIKVFTNSLGIFWLSVRSYKLVTNTENCISL